MTVIDDGLHLKLLFSTDDIWGRPREVGAMGGCLAIRGQEGGMEDVMDGPGGGKLESVSNR